MSMITNDDLAIERLLNFVSAPWWTTSAKRKLLAFDGAIPFFGPFVDLMDAWSTLPGVWFDAEPDATGRFARLSLLQTSQKDDDPTDFIMCKTNYESARKLRIVYGFPNTRTGTIHIKRTRGIMVGKRPKLTTFDGHDWSWWKSNCRPGCEAGMRKDRQDEEKYFEWSAKAAAGMFFNMYHSWSTYFRILGSISIRFPVDPRTALELFSDREKEPGKLRRDALLHWVKAHLRRKRNTDHDMIEVRKHIRGKEQFFWHGFECIIAPDDDYLNSISAKK